MVDIGARVRAVRESKRLSQAQVYGRMAQIDPDNLPGTGWLPSLEAGGPGRDATVTRMALLARALGVTLDELVRDTEDIA